MSLADLTRVGRMWIPAIAAGRTVIRRAVGERASVPQGGERTTVPGVGAEMTFTTDIDSVRARRLVAGSSVILHCHHYNSRLQKAIEGTTAVDGRGLWMASAESSWTGVLERAVAGVSAPRDRWQRCLDLYQFLGFGRLQVPDGELPETQVVGVASHFVEGWSAREPERTQPVCSFTAGFLQAAVWVALGRAVSFEEVACQQGRAPACEFVLRPRAGAAPRPIGVAAAKPSDAPAGPVAPVRPGVDEAKIVEAVSSMPIAGDDRGLIPAFNVFLASMPADFYNHASVTFLAAMREAGMGALGRRLLMQVAEICGLNTFAGIRSSAEWDALIAPMCHDPADEMIGLVAVSNALGWGSWRVTDLVPGESMRLSAGNGYEAEGQLELVGPSHEPCCVMLTGVSAGLMDLVYGTGSVRERVGQFAASEHRCRASGAERCEFLAEEAA